MPRDFIADPSSRLDFALYWGDWLADGDTVASAEWTAPDGVTIEDDQINTVTLNVPHPDVLGRMITCTPGTLTTVWLKEPPAGGAVRLACKVVTAQGRVDERSITVRPAQR